MMSKQSKFQVKYGQWSTDYIVVDGDELEKLHYAKKIGAFFTGKYGDVDTTKIVSVRPDYKETYGAMPEYQLVGEDYDEMYREFGDISAMIGEAKERAEYLIQTNQKHLIGKGVKIPELERPKVERREGGVRSIGEMLTP